VRNFLAYDSDEKRAIELLRKRVPVNEGELAEAVAEVAENQFVSPGMRPVCRNTRNSAVTAFVGTSALPTNALHPLHVTSTVTCHA
jgi:hypothetical protein